MSCISRTGSNPVSSLFATQQQQLDVEAQRDWIQLDVANALWAAKGKAFLPSFMKTAGDDYQAEIKRASFSDTKSTPRVAK